MPDLGELLGGFPARLTEPILRCQRGETPPNIALMHVLIEARDEDEVEALLARVERLGGPGAERIGEIAWLWRANPQAWSVVKSVMDHVKHDGIAARPEEAVARFAAGFDRAARAAPEGSVALYALGNPDLLRAATAEIVEGMRGRGLLGRDRRMLDFGCGGGRFEEALAAEVAEIVGIDISAEMIARARRLCAGLTNVRFRQSSGRDLAGFADASFDLVLAVDSFPYLVQAGGDLAERLLAEAARVLKPGGDLLILNFSYRGDEGADRADVRRFAAASGLRMRREGTRDFALWDAAAFHLKRM